MQILAFIKEGRIIAGSFISKNPATGFYPAGGTEFFEPDSPEAIIPITAGPVPQQTPISHQQIHNHPAQPISDYNPQTLAPAPQSLGSTPNSVVYLIMAEIASDQKMRFLHLIQKLGAAQRIGDSVWLLKANIDIDDLKTQLSATLTRQDRLFILDSFNNKTAWHNIGADMGERIGELWNNDN